MPTKKMTGEDNIAKHQELFVKLVSSGAFDMQNGKVIMHFSQGELMKIDAESVIYKHPQKATSIVVGFVQKNML